MPCWAGEWAKSYSLLFETNDANAAVDLHMGNTAEWSWNNGQFLMIRNLRSYETGADDDDWNWGWWAAGWLTLEG